MPQLAQRRCGSFGSPQFSQLAIDGGVNASCERRFLVREWECLLFGKAIIFPPNEKFVLLFIVVTECVFDQVFNTK